MQQTFRITQGSTFPHLVMELGLGYQVDNQAFNEKIQTASATFTLESLQDCGKKILCRKADIVENFCLKDGCNDCGQKFYIIYRWNERDTKQKGKYKGYFTFTFANGEVSILPISETLIIEII